MARAEPSMSAIGQGIRFYCSEVAANPAGGLSGGSVPQRGGSMPAHGEAFDFSSHGFQILHLQGAPLALRQVLLARERICRVQFFVEKRMKNELPFCAGPNRARTALGPLDRGHAHEVAEREHPLISPADGGFAESLL
jgi:hypothetical protein